MRALCKEEPSLGQRQARQYRHVNPEKWAKGCRQEDEGQERGHGDICMVRVGEEGWEGGTVKHSSHREYPVKDQGQEGAGSLGTDRVGTAGGGSRQDGAGRQIIRQGTECGCHSQGGQPPQGPAPLSPWQGPPSVQQHSLSDRVPSRTSWTTSPS